MNWIREWFVKQWRPIEQADKTREFQVGGVVGRPKDEWVYSDVVCMATPDQSEREKEQVKREQERTELDRRVLEMWQDEDSIKLQCFRFTWANKTYDSLYVTRQDALDNLYALYHRPHVTCLAYTENGFLAKWHIRNDFARCMIEDMRKFVLFEGKPTLVPEG